MATQQGEMVKIPTLWIDEINTIKDVNDKVFYYFGYIGNEYTNKDGALYDFRGHFVQFINYAEFVNMRQLFDGIVA